MFGQTILDRTRTMLPVTHVKTGCLEASQMYSLGIWSLFSFEYGRSLTMPPPRCFLHNGFVPSSTMATKYSAFDYVAEKALIFVSEEYASSDKLSCHHSNAALLVCTCSNTCTSGCHLRLCSETSAHLKLHFHTVLRLTRVRSALRPGTQISAQSTSTQLDSQFITHRAGKLWNDTRLSKP